jgi:hypothetical protein
VSAAEAALAGACLEASKPCAAAADARCADADVFLRRVGTSPGAQPPAASVHALARRLADARTAAATLRSGAPQRAPQPAPQQLPPGAAQRAALLQGNQRLAASSERLGDAARTAHAAEAAGADILAALASQRAHIQRVRDAHAEVDAEVAQSSTILNRMQRWWRVGL